MNAVSHTTERYGNGEVRTILTWRYHDGGRAAAGYKGEVGDCVIRSIAIATERPYQEIYDLVRRFAAGERMGKRKRPKSNPRTGVRIRTAHKIMESLGWRWAPTMRIGAGCQIHLRNDELPPGRLVVRLSKHLTAVVDGTCYDTADPAREGTRCVYGYWFNPKGTR